jgi:hypothetical protein
MDSGGLRDAFQHYLAPGGEFEGFLVGLELFVVEVDFHGEVRVRVRVREGFGFMD